MERYHRKTPVDAVKKMWTVIRNEDGEVEHTRLVKVLQKEFPSATDQIESYVSNAVVDGLIQVVDKPKRPKPKSVYHYALPEADKVSFPDDHPDFYCYECHLEGNVSKCVGCLRVFHLGCVAKSDGKQVIMERFSTKKRVSMSDFGTSAGAAAAAETRSVNSPAPSVASQPEIAQIRMPTPMIDSNRNESKIDVKQEDLKQELLSDEPQFVGVIRPPDRRLEERLNTPTVKPEDNCVSIMDSEELMQKFCYPCRQVQGNQYNTPPNMTQAELNYLLKFIVDEYKSWLPADTYSLTRLFNNQPRSPERLENLELSKKLLLRFADRSIETIAKKIEQEQYETLEEFSADIQDIAHNIAVIHGPGSLEYSAAMYFITDCTYDLYEIRQCRDCFRHSNEKAEPDWFARPCHTRHELVFAKQKGYQHWPAKVVRVCNNKYDVRFFGGTHTRAVVDAIYVKPIDSDFEQLKINPKQRGFQLAMDELHKHQALISLPKDKEYYVYGSKTPPISVLLQNAGVEISPMPIQQLTTFPKTPKRRGRKPKARSYANLTSAKSTTSVPQLADESSDQVAPQLEACPASPPPNTNAQATNPSNVRQKRALETPAAPSEPKTPTKRVKARSHNGEPTDAPGTSSAALALPGPSNEPPPKPRSPRIKAQLKRQYSEDAIKLKELMDEIDDIETVKRLAVNALQEDIDRWQKKIRSVINEYTLRIDAIKRKRWCNICDLEAILHCCFNVSYCSRICQEKDWSEHKKKHQFTKQ
uniref:Putative the pwwp domain is part of bs69 protein n=1 Tax=Culex tarsalis TaxID=7177 RepID=A0A1Q3F5R1_CULTA